MPRWDKKSVYRSYFINKDLQQNIEYENNNKDRQNQKFIWKMRGEGVEAI